MTTETTSAPHALDARRSSSRRGRRRRADRGRSYTAVASFYETLAACYSGGQIAAAKRAQLAEMQPGDRVLYVGVGAGEDAVVAARLGAQLTCIDLSSAMLSRLEARLGATQAEILCGNAFDHHRPGHYDVVTANFLLNCLSEPAMREMLAHLSTLLRPGNVVARMTQRVYGRFANVIFRLLNLVTLHPIYDYRRSLAACHLQHVRSTSFRLFGFGPVAYETLTAVRTL
jgi:ubiquinone/menaquinone biosynthesis C-methylase UbiE